MRLGGHECESSGVACRCKCGEEWGGEYGGNGGKIHGILAVIPFHKEVDYYLAKISPVVNDNPALRPLTKRDNFK